MKINAKTIHSNDGWWVAQFEIDGRQYGTQSKTFSGLTAMIEDVAAMLDYKNVDVELALPTELAEVVGSYKQARQRAENAKTELGLVARQTATGLKETGLSMRDIAQMLGITPGRVGQLVKG